MEFWVWALMVIPATLSASILRWVSIVLSGRRNIKRAVVGFHQYTGSGGDTLMCPISLYMYILGRKPCQSSF
ncbi:hypothetical protein LguiA_023799 [Lonicera macranthoides]